MKATKNNKGKLRKTNRRLPLPNNDTIMSLIYANKYNHLFPKGKSHYGSAIVGATILRDYLRGKQEHKRP